jgi:hypothetical protein
MSLLALTNQLTPHTAPLAALFLDPNNPRFVDAAWTPIPDSSIADPDVQERTRQRMVKEFSVDKLRMNMEVNGYLPIDRVIVREFAPDKYVVLEGNRRICAAKMISTLTMDGSAVSEEVLASLGSIPVLVYTGGDFNAAWIFQGLRHISGVEDWSAFNKAKLLVEQMESDDLSLSDAGRRFGLTAHGAGQWVRGYYAFKQAKEESDFVAELDERSYPYFQELFSRSSAAVRDWMQWDDQERKFTNLINFNEYVSWLYPRMPEEDGEPSGKGDWERRFIARRDDIRDIAFLLRESPEHFQQFRHSGQLEQAYSQALSKKYEEEAKDKADPVSEVFTAMRQTSKLLDNLPLKVHKDPGLKMQLDTLIAELEGRIAAVK